jgi:hypothetical protein
LGFKRERLAGKGAVTGGISGGRKKMTGSPDMWDPVVGEGEREVRYRFGNSPGWAVGRN